VVRQGRMGRRLGRRAGRLIFSIPTILPAVECRVIVPRMRRNVERSGTVRCARAASYALRRTGTA
jgi:hypothetical protein